MKKITVIASAVLAVLSLGLAGCKKAPAKADNSLEELKGRGVFVLGLDDSFPPLGYIDADEPTTGYDSELAKELASRLGGEVEARPIDWSA